MVLNDFYQFSSDTQDCIPRILLPACVSKVIKDF